MCTSPPPLPQTPSPQSSGCGSADDFLDALLHDSSSVPASPLLSPSTTGNGVNKDPLAGLTDSPHPVSHATFDICFCSQPLDKENTPETKEELLDVSVDLGKAGKVDTFVETD